MGRGLRVFAASGWLLVGCGSTPSPAADADVQPIDARIPSACGDCPAPAPGRMSVCGWLYDAETDDIIGTGDTDQAGIDCDSIEPRPTSGPCALEVRFYDALMFAGNPTGTPPLSSERLTVNTCGRFIAESMPAPALGYLAVAVDDHGSATDDRWLSATVLASMANLLRHDLPLYSVRRSTDATWTSSAGDPFGGSTFGERGTDLFVFRHLGTPVAGVTVAGEAYYFDDQDATERTSIDTTQDATGANGSALVTDLALSMVSPQGGLPPGCEWESLLAGGGTPGVYFVQPYDADCP